MTEHRSKTKHKYTLGFLINDCWGLDGPGGPRTHSRRRGAKHPAIWTGLWGPDPEKAMVSGLGTINFHYILIRSCG